MAPPHRRTPGPLLYGGVWHIDKVIYRKRICESTGTRDLTEAQALLGAAGDPRASPAISVVRSRA
jgi:hypothetical protein